MADLQPRVLNGSIWLFTAIAALILWYRLPVDPFHKYRWRRIRLTEQALR